MNSISVNFQVHNTKKKTVFTTLHWGSDYKSLTSKGDTYADWENLQNR